VPLSTGSPRLAGSIRRRILLGTSPSETVYLNQGVRYRMRAHTASQKDRKAIAALADSVRKLLSLRILASGTTFRLQCPIEDAEQQRDVVLITL
jgi:hypothetical protein